MPGFEIFGEEEKKEVMDVMETGVLTRYNFDVERKGVFKVRQFEQEFAAYHKSRYALGVTSGSSALKVALAALDVGPGDEVIVPAFTFLATYEAVLEVGAVPVMADIDDTLNLDPEEINRKKTKYTKAVIPVHMCGAPARIDRIIAAARQNSLLLLEDNAQSCGGSFAGKKLGTFGDMGIFSFDYYKTMTTGEGGMVITDDKNLYDRADWYHDHGHDHVGMNRAAEGRTITGFNYRMNELQGALGIAQFRKIDYITSEQKKNKARLKEIFSQIKGLGFRAMADPEGDTATFFGFNMPDAASAKKLQKTLSEGVVDSVYFKENRWHYVPNWEHFLAQSFANSRKYPYKDPGYKGKVSYGREMIPQAEEILGRTLFMGIPIRMSEERFGVISKAVEKAAKAV
jgi:8-amino-3,8-dideoxy-alpha-D-manno-octulosonate transaminase